jgi:hypothetical protein
MFWYDLSHHQFLIFKKFSEYLQLQVGVRSDPLLKNNNHFFICLVTVPKPLPKMVTRRMRSSASSFNLQFLLFSLKSSSSCFHHYPCLPFAAILPPIFPLVMCFRRQFQYNMWLLQLAFTLYSMFLSPFTLCNTSSFLTRSVQQIFSLPLQHHISKLSRHFWSTFQSVHSTHTLPHGAYAFLRS